MNKFQKIVTSLLLLVLITLVLMMTSESFWQMLLPVLKQVLLILLLGVPVICMILLFAGRRKKGKYSKALTSIFVLLCVFLILGGIGVFTIGMMGDCVLNINGKVYDAQTGKPLKSVCINYGESTYSDSSGEFNIYKISGGIGGCSSVHVSISKDGYESINTILFSDDSAKVKMIRKKH